MSPLFQLDSHIDLKCRVLNVISTLKHLNYNLITGRFGLGGGGGTSYQSGKLSPGHAVLKRHTSSEDMLAFLQASLTEQPRTASHTACKALAKLRFSPACKSVIDALSAGQT